MRFFHSGDLGDIIYAIPSIRDLCDGEPADLYLGNRDWTRSVWTEDLVANIKPFLLSQGLNSVTVLPRSELPESPFIDFSTFRNGGYRIGDTILERQRRWVRAKIDISKPWLKISPDPQTEGFILVNRASRWHGFAFPWRQILDAFPPEEILFVGLASEREAFHKEFGPVLFYPTKDLLALARAIAGCEFFIGNQSCPNAIANGLHCPSLLEVCPYGPDCFLPRPNASYCLDGKLNIEILGRSLSTPAKDPTPADLKEWDHLLPLFLDNARRAWGKAYCEEILVQ